MIEFILANMAPIGTSLVAIILIIYALVTRQWMVLRSAALSFMLSAERLMATEEGRKKMDWVLSAVWDQVPGWVRKFYDKNKLQHKLQEWYDIAKDMLRE